VHAQWDDDVHHALHALLTGERQGYYEDFGSPECLEAVFTGAFWHAGTWSPFRRRTHGRPVDRERTPAHRFVAFLQDHDQVGNRATGDRLTATLSPGQLRVAATLLLTGPFTPMLFMGEEWGATTPWQYFTSHPEPDLAEAVRNGRRREFGAHGWPEDDVPDPQDPATFERSKLDWSEVQNPPHQRLYQVYRSLIALRKARPELADPRLDRVAVTFDGDVVTIVRGGLRVIANLGPDPRPIRAREIVFATEPAATLTELPGESAVVAVV
jgi:maltooligosyltrehalose trehalohydrolase